MIAALLDHLWQSTLFALACAALSLAFRANRAGVRFWLWFAASLKFLLPFALLAALGARLSALFPQVALHQTAPRLILIRAEHLSEPARLLAHPQGAGDAMTAVAPWLVGLWLAGMAILLAVRAMRWFRLMAAVDAGRELALAAPVPVRASAAQMEPGLVGILRPVIVFPIGLLDRLSRAEIDAILAHEGAHLKRRDNLTAAIHMLVEGLFWFHPLVWLIGARMVDERERACDECVLAHGHDAQVYADGILGVCRFCIASPLACAAGAGGANLSLRVARIMTGEARDDVGGGKQLLLLGAALISLMLPIAAGFFSSPLTVAVHAQVVAAQARAELAIRDSMTAMAEQIGAAPAPSVDIAHVHHVRVARVMPPPVVGPPIPVPQAAPAPQPLAASQPDVSTAPAAVKVEASPTPQLQQAALALDPRGDGDPEAVTCRVPQSLPGTRLPGPTVCKINRLWAELRANRAVISPDGREVDLPSDGERRRSLNAVSCNVSRQMGGATNSTIGLPLAFCF